MAETGDKLNIDGIIARLLEGKEMGIVNTNSNLQSIYILWVHLINYLC